VDLVDLLRSAPGLDSGANYAASKDGVWRSGRVTVTHLPLLPRSAGICRSPLGGHAPASRPGAAAAEQRRPPQPQRVARR